MMVGRVFSDNTIARTISADVADYNVFTEGGSPAAASDFVVTIAEGVTVYQNAATAALRTGSVPAGSTVTLRNLGSVVGKGGGGNGGTGGDAVRCDAGTLRIDNGAGLIAGGGGGGGLGYSEGPVSPSIAGAGGGGGGGGRGRISSGGGSGASNYAVAGASGSGGDSTAAGGGGSGGQNTLYGNLAGAGGAGGDYGMSGSPGDYGNSGIYGSPGGSGGNAVRVAAGAVVWLSGYDSSRVKGNVGT